MTIDTFTAELDDKRKSIELKWKHHGIVNESLSNIRVVVRIMVYTYVPSL